MHPCQGIFLSSNPDPSLRPLYIFPVQIFLQYLDSKFRVSIMIQWKSLNMHSTRTLSSMSIVISGNLHKELKKAKQGPREKSLPRSPSELNHTVVIKFKSIELTIGQHKKAFCFIEKLKQESRYAACILTSKTED